MSWLFSQALVEEYSARTLWDGEPCAQLNVMPTPHKFWRNDKTMEFSDLSRFGLTLRLLTEQDCEALLMSYLRDFPAKTSLLREVARESKGSGVDCGSMCPASFAKLEQEKSGWRTHQLSLLGGWEPFSETWPRWGLMLNGECWEEDISALGICESESGYTLPTIGKNEYKGASRKRYRGSKDFRGAKMVEGLRVSENDPIYLTPLFAEIAMMWPSTWTELAPLETGRFQQWLQKHGAFSPVKEAA